MQQVEMIDPRQENRMYQEAIKNLRTNLQFAGVDVKCVVITSCFPNEGKSDVSMQLARELGNIHKKTLYIDADIRKSALVSRYQVKGHIRGLSHYLSGQAELDQVLYQTNYRNMDILFAGTMAPNPAELLESSRMTELLAEVRERYDYVLIDTPPIASMTDAAIVAKRCDGAVMVVESRKVGYRIAQKAKAQLQQSGCRILGVVLNKVDTENDRYYGRYGYYGKYGRYGKYGKYGYGSYYGDSKETAVTEGAADSQAAPGEEKAGDQDESEK